MSKPTGYWGWRVRNPRLPAPTEFRTMPDGGTKVVWEGVTHDWRDVSLETERDLTRALAQYV